MRQRAMKMNVLKSKKDLMALIVICDAKIKTVEVESLTNGA
jgi:hypothetical protein